MSTIDLSPLGDAIVQLDAGIREAERYPNHELLRDGVIQRFEYSHELGLKFLRRVLETIFGDDVDRAPYNEILRSAAERELIKDVESWFAYRSARNKTSHTYDARVAIEVYKVAQQFLPDVTYLFTRLNDVVSAASA
ncbi:MAG: HI0074 family nucleotidyltransferase substrate-binding subunit [Pirellulales bacterium]